MFFLIFLTFRWHLALLKLKNMVHATVYGLLCLGFVVSRVLYSTIMSWSKLFLDRVGFVGVQLCWERGRCEGNKDYKFYGLDVCVICAWYVWWDVYLCVCVCACVCWCMSYITFKRPETLFAFFMSSIYYILCLGFVMGLSVLSSVCLSKVYHST